MSKIVIVGSIVSAMITSGAYAGNCPDFIKEGNEYEFHYGMAAPKATVVKYDDDTCWAEVRYKGKKVWFNLNTASAVEPINKRK